MAPPTPALSLPQGVVRGGHHLEPTASGGFADLAGRLVEISGGAEHASLSYAGQLVAWAQQHGETTAWLQPAAAGAAVHPPDLAAAGVELGALVWVRVPPQRGAAGLARAAEMLLASGAMGLVVLDFLALAPPPGSGWQARLLAQARATASCTLLLTDKAAALPSLGALCSWRVEPRRRPQQEAGFVLAPRVLRGSPGWPHQPRPCRGPW